MPVSEFAEVWADTLANSDDTTDINEIYLGKDWDFSAYPDGHLLEDVPRIQNTSKDASPATGHHAEIVSTHLNNGHKSAYDVMPPHLEDCNLAWGFITTFRNDSGTRKDELYEGDEVWARIYGNYPSDFVYEDQAGGNDSSFKTIRFEAQTGGKFTEINFHQVQKNIRVSSFINWSGPDSGHWIMGDALDFMDGRFHCIEFYLKVSSTTTNGDAKAWYDGSPLDNYSQVKVQSLAQPGEFIHLVRYHTWWDNVNNDRTNHHWYADPAIAIRRADRSRDDTLHMARDANGFPYIGLAT